jgi:hypothetical protein
MERRNTKRQFKKAKKTIKTVLGGIKIRYPQGCVGSIPSLGTRN